MGGGPGRRKKPADTTRMYEVLGVNKSDAPDTIRKAYRKLAVKNHPGAAPAAARLPSPTPALAAGSG